MKTLIRSCTTFKELQYTTRTLRDLLYIVGNWNQEEHQQLESALNRTVGVQLQSIISSDNLTDTRKDELNQILGDYLIEFLDWYSCIDCLPYQANDLRKYVADSVKLVEYPNEKDFSVRNAWNWTLFNIAQLNWIEFIIFVMKRETICNTTSEAVYHDRHRYFARLVSIANVLCDSELIRYSTDLHMKTFCIKPEKTNTSYAVMQLFSSFDDTLGGYLIADREIFESELQRLHTNFMEN